MDSIYHIDTDIACSVLHYGSEVCVAAPGEDATITLRKGRHKLTFISKENISDQYSIMFEVPENDIEDCIEVRLASYRDARLQKEEDERRAAFEAEQKRAAFEAEQRRLREERLRRENEMKQKKEEEERMRIHRLFEEELSPLNNYILSLSKERQKGSPGIFDCYEPDYDWRKDEDGKYVYHRPRFVKGMGTVENPKFDFATPYFYEVAIVGNLETISQDVHRWHYYYINVNSDVLYEYYEYDSRGTSLHLGVCFIIETKDYFIPTTLKIFDKGFNLLFEKPFDEVINKYVPRPEFPFRIQINKPSHYSFDSFISFSYKDAGLGLNLIEKNGKKEESVTTFYRQKLPTLRELREIEAGIHRHKTFEEVRQEHSERFDIIEGLNC